jgi:peptidoglycan/LPS O-acetylase OafA/YrhL
VILVGIVLSSCVRFYFHNNTDVLHYFSLSVLSDLLIGAFFGIYYEKIKTIFITYSKYLMVASVLMVIALISVRGLVIGDTPPAWFAFVAPLVFALCFAFIIVRGTVAVSPSVSMTLLVDTQTSSLSLTIKNILLYLGRISYGLYVYHMIALALILMLFSATKESVESTSASSLVFLGSFGLTVALASLSYRYLEKPFLKLKSAFMR